MSTGASKPGVQWISWDLTPPRPHLPPQRILSQDGFNKVQQRAARFVTRSMIAIIEKKLEESSEKGEENRLRIKLLG